MWITITVADRLHPVDVRIFLVNVTDFVHQPRATYNNVSKGVLWFVCFLFFSSDINKDWTCKDNDKDQAYKDQDMEKDLNLVFKESLRTMTRTSLTVTYSNLQLNLQSLSSNNNEHKVKIHNIWLQNPLH